MSLAEQQNVREKYYAEATRYMENAREYLKSAQKEGSFYRDQKYVRTACGTAYSGVLVALDGYCVLKEIHTSKSKKERKSIEYYQKNIANQDKKMLDYLNAAYDILHLSGYYDGIQSVEVIKTGFNFANTIIEKIKPLSN
ncbi:MAG: DUF5618 family protein [Tannerella sp.]|jgi:hypothetical protein|nr:DUF5618 family protein [Tannerella sp.]